MSSIDFEWPHKTLDEAVETHVNIGIIFGGRPRLGPDILAQLDGATAPSEGDGVPCCRAGENQDVPFI